MASLNLTIDIPCEPKSVDISALKSQLTAFAKILLSMPSVKSNNAAATNADPFAELDTGWGGDKDSHQIADELYASRTSTRFAETW